MIAPQPFFEPRGTPISVYQRLDGLSRLGHKIDLLTYHVGQDVNLPNVLIHRIPQVPFIRELKVGPSFPKVILDIFLFMKAIKLLISNRYEIIHSHEEAAIFSTLLAAIFRKAHLYDMHSSLPKQLVNFNYGSYRPIIKLFDLFERWTIKSADAIITIGPDLEKHVYRINPEATQITIENLPLHLQRANPLEDPRKQWAVNDEIVVVYTGTFERYQGIELLIESARIVNDKYPRVVFMLVGGKRNQIQNLRELTIELHLENSVHFVGSVSLEMANQYMEMADILVSPRVEGTSVPLKIYSYLHIGKPIVATNLVAHTSVLDDEVAVLVEPTAEALSDGLIRLIRDPQLREKLAQRSKKIVEEKYNIADYLSKLEKIYSSLMPSKSISAHPVQAVGEPNEN